MHILWYRLTSVECSLFNMHSVATSKPSAHQHNLYICSTKSSIDLLTFMSFTHYVKKSSWNSIQSISCAEAIHVRIVTSEQHEVK